MNGKQVMNECMARWVAVECECAVEDGAGRTSGCFVSVHAFESGLILALMPSLILHPSFLHCTLPQFDVKQIYALHYCSRNCKLRRKGTCIFYNEWHVLLTVTGLTAVLTR